MALDLEDMSRRFDKAIDDFFKNATPEEIEKYFPKDKTPKGWVSIEDALPMMLAIDIRNGCTMYLVKDKNGNEYYSGVADHNIWKYYAREEGITHWWNPERLCVVVQPDGITAKEVNPVKMPDAFFEGKMSKRNEAEEKLRTFEIQNRAYYGRHPETGEDMYGGFKSDAEHYAEVMPNGKIQIID